MTSHAKRPGAFDIGSGWYAQAGQDGSVTLWSGVDQEETTIPARTWVRLVASVSAAGLSDECLTAATALHRGGAA